MALSNEHFEQAKQAIFTAMQKHETISFENYVSTDTGTDLHIEIEYYADVEWDSAHCNTDISARFIDVRVYIEGDEVHPSTQQLNELEREVTLNL